MSKENNDKFLNRNKENFDKLNLFIEQNRNNLCLICNSPEMWEYLKLSDKCVVYKEDHMKYNNIRVIVDGYFLTPAIGFIMKDNRIKFDLPCVCGIYSNEIHP
jgi:hypothetical protein